MMTVQGFDLVFLEIPGLNCIKGLLFTFHCFLVCKGRYLEYTASDNSGDSVAYPVGCNRATGANAAPFIKYKEI